MDTHDFQDHVKVQRFCLTLVGEARLWYNSLRPINTDWEELQHMFRQQYSKIGNTREQLFHTWRSFYFDENTKTIDAYVHHIRQVANLLGYQDLQVLEVFKNTLSSKLYWVLFPIEDLRVVVDMAQRMLTKEKIDKQLVEQTSLTPFMSVRDSQSKRVSFNTPDNLEQKINRLTVMMGKLVTEDEGLPKPFQPQVYQSNRGRYQSRGNFCSSFRNNAYRDAHHTIKILEVETGVTLVIEEIMDTTQEVVRDIATITMTIGETTIGIKVMIEIGVDH